MALTTPLNKITVRLGTKSGILTDRPQFDLHYIPPETPGSTDYDNARDNILGFFNTVSPGPGFAVNTRLSKSLSVASNDVEIAFYDVPTLPGVLGPPITMRTGTLTAVGTTSAPEEVAACLSWHKDYDDVPEFGPGGTRPRASLRNRIFIGPLANSAADVDPTTFRTVIDPAVITVLLDSALTQLWAAMATDGWSLVAWSQKNWSAGGMVGGVFWMDNAFDTIRGRGPEATARVTSVPLV